MFLGVVEADHLGVDVAAGPEGVEHHARALELVVEVWGVDPDELSESDGEVDLLLEDGHLVGGHNNQLITLEKIVHEEDPTAFMFINDAYQVLGNGFVPLNKVGDEKR